MINFEINILLCLTAVSISGAIHHPQVYEDGIENSSNNENIRTARNSESTYRTAHQPPMFNFNTAKQQDYLRVKYIEQQKMNTVSLVNGMSKSHIYFNQPHNKLYKAVQKTEMDTDDWLPFDPKMPKQNVPDQNYFKTTKDVKLYKPSLLKVGLIPKDMKLSLFPTKNPRIQNEKTLSSPRIRGNSDLDVQSSEIMEKKIDLRETPNKFSKIIFVDPTQLQEQLKHNSDENPNVDIKKPETQLTALNDLIGKNPNVQLEGLKRLLQDPASKNYNIQVEQGPELFQSREHTTDTEQRVQIPNIKINPEDNSITLPHIIGKSSLDDIQKQLDEAAKIQTQQVLARAQQEAQAQVEAQHKAIALAQAQAQKVALENIQKSIYGDAQAQALVQGNYQPIINNPVQSQVNIQPANHNIPDNIMNNNPDNSENGVDNDGSVKHFGTQSRTNSHVAHKISNLKKSVPLYENVPPQTFGSKEVLYYAPNHHHQVAAQLQAEKALLSQVEAQNIAILHNHKRRPSAIRQILKKEQVSSEESDGATAAESKPEATAYQQFTLDSKEAEEVNGEQKDYDDFDELQYAAKYAFGYRIKDAKEGNDFGHEERRDGKNLEGSYHVLLPDGRLQKVEYYADNSGYHAKVTYEHSTHEETSA